MSLNLHNMMSETSKFPIKFYCVNMFSNSPKPSPDFLEDALPDMDSKSEILNEELLKKVSTYILMHSCPF